ncbi:hypothetical protein NL676_033489 [Syzygium grande]|nr:hypothetical protein NL676_033489 [Syzygium grande]
MALCPFFIWHRPKSNIEDFPNLSDDLWATMDEYIAQVIKLAEKLSELICENLGLDKDHIKRAFSETNGPSVGTKVLIPPSDNATICVNTGDQLEVLSNGRYKSILHRVMAEKNGSRLSVATFYNPANDAIISPAPKLLYPEKYAFGDYLKLYAAIKFQGKSQGLNQ